MKKQLCCLGLALFVCSTGWSDPDPSGKVKNVKAEDAKENGVDALKKAIQDTEPGQKSPEAKKDEAPVKEEPNELQEVSESIDAVGAWFQKIEEIVALKKQENRIKEELEKINTRDIVREGEKVSKNFSNNAKVQAVIGSESENKITLLVKDTCKVVLNLIELVEFWDKTGRPKAREIFMDLRKNISDFTRTAVNGKVQARITAGKQ